MIDDNHWQNAIKTINPFAYSSQEKMKVHQNEHYKL